PTGHAAEEVELLAELPIELAVGNVATGRDIDVLDHQALPLAEQLDADVAGFAVVLPVVLRELAERYPADRGYAVVTLLPVHHAMPVAERLERRVRELLLAALDLLQAQHVGRVLADEAFDLRDPQADRIDVPGGDRDHAGGIGTEGACGKVAGGGLGHGRQAEAEKKNPRPGGIGTGVPISVRHAAPTARSRSGQQVGNPPQAVKPLKPRRPGLSRK